MHDPSVNSILGWMVKYGIKTENGKVFDFKHHPFWLDPLCDWSPNQVMLKAAQMGGTTALSFKLLWAMKRYGLNCAYTMPTADDVKQFVGGRLNAIIRQNPVIDSWIDDKDSVEQKRIGNNIVYFRGTQTERAALSFPSDLNVFDEEDRSNKFIVEQYSSRQQHSTYKWNWHLSNPSVPGNGVSQYWGRSDQKHWFITCSKCNEKQFLSWPDSIDVEQKSFVCKRCHAPIDNEVRRKGAWHGIKTLIQPEFSGYWFNLMMAPWVSAEEIIKLHQTKSADYFYNFVLGLPYAGSGNKLNEHEFFANIDPKVNEQDDPIVIGVDTGLPIWYVVGNKQGFFYHGHCDSMHDIEVLMKRWPKSIVVCDQGGDLTAPRELRERYPGRVYLAYYRQDRRTMQLIEWGRGKEAGKVIIDRNRVIQQLMDEFRAKRLPLNGSKEDWWPVWLHFANMYREVEEDAAGNDRYVWQRSGPDHLCFIAGTKIRVEGGEASIEDIKVGDKVWTRQGLKRVYHAGLTASRAQVYEAEFSDGIKIVATPEHPVFVRGQGFKRLDALVYSDMVETWKNNQSFLMVSNSDDTLRLKLEQKEFILHQDQVLENKASEDCTRKFGKRRMVRSLKVLLSTIKMGIHSIMNWRIWNVWMLLSICHSTLKNGWLTQKIKFLINNILIMLGLLAPSGIGLRKGVKQQLHDQKKCGRDKGKSLIPALDVKKFSIRAPLKGLFTVLQHVITTFTCKKIVLNSELKENVEFAANVLNCPNGVELKPALGHVRILSLKKVPKMLPVYGIAVEDSPEYYANTILVTNCHAMVYCRVGLDKFWNASEAKSVGGGVDLDRIFGVKKSVEVGFDGGMRLPKPSEEPYDWRNT